MKLKQYAAEIQKLAEKHPDFDVIYAADDEGNNFYPVVFEPTIGHYDENKNFIVDGDSELQEDQVLNAVCVN